MNLSKFVVGRRISRPNAPEGLFLNLASTGLVVVIRHPNPELSEISNLRRCHIQTRVLELNGLLIFLFRLGMRPWQRIPFHRSRSEIKDVESAELTLTVLLVESESGVLLVRRDEMLSSSLSNKIFDIIRRQSEEEPRTLDYTIRKTMAQMTTVQMVAKAGQNQI